MARRGGARLSVAAAVLALGCAPPATARDDDATSKEIARLETVYSQTFVSGDLATADRLLADDFVAVMGPNAKRYDKAAMLAEVASLPHQTSATVTSVTVRSYGDTAVALGAEDDVNAGAKDVSHRTWLDTWRRTPGGWRMVAFAEITPAP